MCQKLNVFTRETIKLKITFNYHHVFHICNKPQKPYSFVCNNIRTQNKIFKIQYSIFYAIKFNASTWHITDIKAAFYLEYGFICVSHYACILLLGLMKQTSQLILFPQINGKLENFAIWFDRKFKWNFIWSWLNSYDNFGKICNYYFLCMCTSNTNLTVTKHWLNPLFEWRFGMITLKHYIFREN